MLTSGAVSCTLLAVLAAAESRLEWVHVVSSCGEVLRCESETRDIMTRRPVVSGPALIQVGSDSLLAMPHMK